MSNGRTYVTIRGNLVSDPELRTTKNGATFARFRVAVTSRAYVREHDSWLDIETSYYQVAAFNSLGVNVLNCTRKGQPVVVHGYQSVREWTTDDDGPTRRDVQITAEALGHNLLFGRSQFERVHSPMLDEIADRQPAPEEALPPDPDSGAPAQEQPEPAPAYRLSPTAG